MKQALERRYGTAKPDQLPDLVLIDGGKGQVGMARDVFRPWARPSQSSWGGKGRGAAKWAGRAGFRRRKGEAAVGPDSAALMLVAQIRDEGTPLCHYRHAPKRASVRTGGSRLEDIPGVGPKRRAKLLQRFGGVRGVAAATVDELATVDGIQRIWRRKSIVPCVDWKWLGLFAALVLAGAQPSLVRLKIRAVGRGACCQHRGRYVSGGSQRGLPVGGACHAQKLG